MSDSLMDILFFKNGDIDIVKLKGNLDASSVEMFHKLTAEKLDQKSAKIIIDLSGIVFINSSGLGALVLFFKKRSQAGQRVCLCGLNENVYQIFKLVKFDDIYNIYDDLDEALKAYSAAGDDSSAG
ncbi:STAS domain-containing protein [Maridesulfovibrio bastinii]|uniref:STAS domain-containing protein n=1 Tax=Maridesulfovibrio bastinii TaxID=47157 RepID=UPI0003FACADF|nr:STAS domain-containing protein [Maridesulfovibrio bastinii]